MSKRSQNRPQPRPERDHLKMLQSPSDWPKWPLLPLKKRTDRGQLGDVGILLDHSPERRAELGGWRVYLKNLFDGKALDQCEYLTYGTPESILADGWEVD